MPAFIGPGFVEIGIVEISQSALNLERYTYTQTDRQADRQTD